jgi:hypothetical protein
MKIKLVLDIDYNLDEVAYAGISEDAVRDEIHDVLLASVDRLVGEGGLSGETLATVDTWEVNISTPCGCNGRH